MPAEEEARANVAVAVEDAAAVPAKEGEEEGEEATSRCSDRGDGCGLRHERDKDGDSSGRIRDSDSDAKSSSSSSNVKDDAYYASIDETHDGLWTYTGPSGMMMMLDDEDFLQYQEQEWQHDLELDPNLKREEEFVELDLETMSEVGQSLSDRGLSIASGVLRRLAEHSCPPIVRITRLSQEEMSELMDTKRKGNELFVAGQYEKAFESYDNALMCVGCDNLFIAPTDQVTEVVNILSNQAECQLRLQDYDEAAQMATDALVLDSDHEKSRIRRAKAALSIYKKEKKTFGHLVQARHDLKEVINNPDAGALASETAQTFLDEVDELLEKERQRRTEEASNDIDFDMMMRTVDSRCW